MTVMFWILGGIIVGDIGWRVWCWRQARAAHQRVGKPVLYYVAGGRR